MTRLKKVDRAIHKVTGLKMEGFLTYGEMHKVIKKKILSLTLEQQEAVKEELKRGKV